MLETSTGWRPAQKYKQFYGIHFLTSPFSAISQHCLVPWVSFFQSISQMSLASVIESHLGSKWQEARDRKWRKKKNRRERWLGPASYNCSSTVPLLRSLASAVFHRGCFATTAPTTKLPGVWGESEWTKRGEEKKEWFPQSLSFRSSFLLLKAELEGFSWVSLYLFHNAYFCILTEWDQAGNTWGKKYS